ncbi:MAG TPA: TonB family protein [Pirellulaceae bacterium]|nr:TonB family protein [Pirellulaceae bacterium]
MTENWQLFVGHVVAGKFPLRQYLAGGERSAVFLTEYGEREPQKAAIKLVQTDLESAELQLSRWKRAAKLSHPHLVRLFQMGSCELAGLPLLYVVMEYADEDLSQVLPHRRLTAAEARQMLEPAVDALAYLHGERFVHGHLKPANIMAVGEQLKVSSDNLGQIGEAASSRTPAIYDAPEIHRQGISPAGDIWSMGVTLVESLTQRLPVWESTEREEPPLPETLPPPILEIARHCLRRDPQRRWTAAQIAAHLGPAPPPVSQQQMPAPPPVPQRQASAEPQVTFAKRRYFAPAAAVLGLVALAVVLGVPALFEREPVTGPGPSGIEQQGVELEPEQQPVAPETGQAARRTSEESQASPGASASAPASPQATAENTPPGDLAPGEVVREVLPAVPKSASDTIQGTVRVSVKVQVDPSGQVASAEIDSAGPSKYFARRALQAARDWEFTPAEVDSQPVPSEWTLRFEFTRTTTRAIPAVGRVPSRARSRPGL